jgi:hypothetical protein
MVVAVNPVYPVIAAQGVAADITLQSGTVIDARVLKLLANDFVCIAVSNLSIEVMSEVPLQVGQALQLAVSQTQDGVRLQIVPQTISDAAASGSGETPATIVTTSARGASSAFSASITSAPVSAPANALPDAAHITRPLTTLEALAVSAAVQSAAARQGSLSPLFANVSAAASSGSLPQTLQQAAQQLLSVRPVLDSNLSGEDVKTAFQNSGLFLERSQKQQSAAVLPQSQVTATPDLKAALIVFRQTLASWIGDASEPEGQNSKLLQPEIITPSETAVADEATPQPGTFAQQGQARVQAELAAPLAPSLAPEIEMDEILLPQASLPVAEDIDNLGMVLRDVTPSSVSSANAAARGAASAAMSGAMMNVMQGEDASSLGEMMRAFPKGLQDAVITLLEAEGQGTGAKAAIGRPGGPADVPPGHDGVPPPFRGAAPSAQGIASPSVAADASPDAVAHHLLDDTDAALARQTLLQIASLPDRVDQPGVRADLNVPRWNFEIPFATPQGTAVAQFEISRDGGDNEVAAAATKVWRARFSLNVEPAGPVHALVSLTGEKTSVRMWAERASTAQQLRAGKSDLTQALREAELTPGDIVIAEGHAPSPAGPPRGHFLDRAL